MTIKQLPSPNFTQGRKQYRPEAIVVHIIQGSLADADDSYRNSATGRSAHYAVGATGEVHQYVSDMHTAWHAGRVKDPSWSLIKAAGKGLYVNPNLYTIGIDHEGQVDTEWSEAMYAASAELIRDLCAKWNIPVDRDHIIGHNEIFTQNSCPGLKVDLNKLVTMAGGKPAPAPVAASPNPQKVDAAGRALTRSRLNLRTLPSTKAAVARTVEENVQLAFDGYTIDGEAVKNSSKWYHSPDGWFWGGAVDIQPDVPAFNKVVTDDGNTPTLEQVRNTTGARAQVAAKFLPFIQETCHKYNIDTPARQLCFLAQVGHESGGLFYTEELASGKAYEGRTDLGNTHSGDGPKYKGRGLIQITGRTNYGALSKAFDVDLIANPEKLGGKNSGVCTEEQLRYAALSAGWFWNSRKLNDLADAMDVFKPVDEDNNMRQFKLITKKINGGYNGLQDRVHKYQNGVSYFTQTG